MRIRDKNNEGETIYLSPYLFLDISVKTKQYLQLIKSSYFKSICRFIKN
jgi:hypothetical protein